MSDRCGILEGWLWTWVVWGFLLCLCPTCTLHAAEEPLPDTIRFAEGGLLTGDMATDTTAWTSYYTHNPSKATLYSMVLPGLGQAYNRRYWEIPIVYAAIGTSAYLYVRFNNEFKKFRQAYQDYYDTDASTNSYLNFDIPKGVTTERYITVYKDNYRKWRDWAGIAVIASYVLNVVDATVYAHFFDFNVDDNLSLHLRPAIIRDAAQKKSIGLNMNLSF